MKKHSRCKGELAKKKNDYSTEVIKQLGANAFGMGGNWDLNVK